MAKLDKILFSDEWDEKFPFSVQKSLARQLSDHTPASLDNCVRLRPNIFRFEKVWLNVNGFKKFVHIFWSNC